MSQVTQILSQIEEGDTQAANKLLPLVYDELRKIAAAKLAQEKPGQTLQATALVHEAYLRLVGPACRADPREAEASSVKSDPADGLFNDRAHFFRAAAEAMRRILVDNARRKRSVKHGGDRIRVDLVEAPASDCFDLNDVIAVHDALAKFEQRDPAKAELVKLRYFVGLTIEEAAAMLGISHATAERHWAYAKTWLYRELARTVPPPPEECK